jgi:hypothetical protein
LCEVIALKSDGFAGGASDGTPARKQKWVDRPIDTRKNSAKNKNFAFDENTEKSFRAAFFEVKALNFHQNKSTRWPSAESQ